ncbi:MAG: PEGA domain-containing protein [Spirochaetia bacterium]|nr:PEGA domain-containing protein [Spirochaetia bacterium]
MLRTTRPEPAMVVHPRRLILMALALATATWSLGAQAAKTVAWAELDSSEAPADYRSAGASVPVLLMRALSFAGERLLSDAELESAGALEGQARITAARAAVAKAQRARDLAALTETDPAKRAHDLAAAEKTLRQARADLEAALNAGTDAEPQGSVVTLAPWAKHATGVLVQAGGEPAAHCKEHSLDYLFHGSIRSSGRFLAVHIKLYSAAAGIDVWSATEYAAPDDLASAVDALTRPAATAILGRPYARLTVLAAPVESRITLDDHHAYQSGAIYYEASAVNIELSAPGYSSTSALASLEPGADTFLAVELEPLAAGPVLVTSDPPGASIYVDGVLAGVTPLELPGFDGERVVRLTLPDSEDVQARIGPEDSGDTLSFSFEPASDGSFAQRFDQAKDDFYRSLGWFILSLPVTTLSYGTFRSWYDAENDALSSGLSDPATMQTLETNYWTAQGVFWASAAVSAGLAVNAVIKLIRYVDAAD